MSTRFFASVRRNQKQWMVVVTGLALVSFLFLDDLGKGQGPISSLGGALIVGSLCAALACIIGYPRHQTVEFGVGGFLVGFLAGFVGFGAVSGNSPVVRTSVGSFTRADLMQLADERSRLNQFIRLVTTKAENPQAAEYFGNNQAQLPQMLDYRLQLIEAQKMGISISDESVNEFLKKLTQGKLTASQFRECLNEAKLGQNQLFSALKNELTARMYTQLSDPPAHVPPILPFIAQRLGTTQIRLMQETPQQLWETFEKLRLKESLEVVKLPVKDFIAKVKEPTDAELATFFDLYKARQGSDEATPGFLEPPQVQLAYLTVGLKNFSHFEQGTEPTDAEVEEYYNKNKERYRISAPRMPDSVLNSPVPQSPAPPMQPLPDDQADATRPENQPPAAEAIQQPEAEKTPNEKGTDEPAKSSEQDEELDETDSVDEGEKGSEAPANGADAATAEVPSKTETPVKADEPTNSTSSLPSAGDLPDAPATPKYRELNDELKFEIREVIVRERAFSRISTALDDAKDVMDDMRLEYDGIADAKQKAEKAKSMAEALRKYAAEHHLEYVETSEMNHEQLMAEPIGRAINVRDRSAVSEEVFMRSRDNAPRLPLFTPRRADGRLMDTAFAYWKIADIAQRIPELTEKGVRDKVLAGWKFDQARALAEQRAKDLVKKAQADKADLPAAMSGESITGEKSDPPVEIIPTEPFTWLTTNTTFPGSGGMPTLSMIPLLGNVGNDFMQTVFKDLQVGDVGEAYDATKSIFYVVKVVKRDLANDDDGGIAAREIHQRFMKERFDSMFFPQDMTPYQALSLIPQSQIDNAWNLRAMQQYNVAWDARAFPQERE